MKKRLKILLLVWHVFAGFSTFASGSDEKNPLLFTDRGFCVSGDTVSLMLKLPAATAKEGLVVRFQLESINGNIIESVAVVSSEGWADGYLPIADSLGSGQYFITAFLLNKGNSYVAPVTKSLLVYNRFEDEISKLNIINGEQIVPVNSDGVLKIITGKDDYKTREEVTVNFDLPEGFNLSEAVIKAALVDPLEKLTKNYHFEYSVSGLPEAGFVESNGFLLSGKVSDIAGKLQPGVLVVISLPASEAYFDYCVTDSTGAFHFFLKNAFGATDAVFQVFSNSEKKYQLWLENGALQRPGKLEAEQIVLTPEQSDFIKNTLNSSFARHVFYPVKLMQSGFFSMEPPDSIPFYGIPTYRVYPGLFIDLPDFREISRELLPGFQYRIRNGETVFRIHNRKRDEYFREEPLRLLNGIPVFDNQLFVSLKSTDIKYVDLVLAERIYGDMIFNGVIAVSLKNKSNMWLGNQSNLFRQNITLLQAAKSRSESIRWSEKVNEPDTRQVFIWEKLLKNPENISFELSDRKGSLEISVEGFTDDNRYFKSVKTIEVK